mgnify:FL=1
MEIKSHHAETLRSLAAAHHADLLAQLIRLRREFGDTTHPVVVKAEAEVATARELVQALVEDA